jgi:hypothetical protein
VKSARLPQKPSLSGLPPPDSSLRSPVSGLRSRPSRLSVASRTLAALAGGYTVTALLATTIALFDRHAPREEAIAAGTTPAFLTFAGCIVWSFAASTATRAWLGVGIPGGVLALLVWRLRSV